MDTSFPPLPIGKTSTVRTNVPTRFEVRTSGGTVVSVTLPPGIQLSVLVGNDLERLDIEPLLQEVIGPRSVE